MNKSWILLTALVLVSISFAGCSKKTDNGGQVDASNIDENAVYDSVLADTGFRVSGTVSAAATPLPTGANGSAASADTLDSAADDSGGAVDKANFVLDAKETDGTQVQAVLKSMAAGSDVNSEADHLGGVGNGVQVFGTTGLGPSEFPETKAYLALFGMSRIRLSGETLERSHFTQVFVTKGVRAADGALVTAIEDNDLEMHVLIGNVAGGAGGNESGMPEVPDGFLYYYFENVKLKQLSPDEKAKVGEKLSAPEKANIPPVVVAQVKLANGTPATSGLLVSGTGPGNLTVILDASNSTDPDGEIEAYSWDVKEFNNTGFLQPAGNQSKPSGAMVNFTFTSAGMKAIGLRIIDADGGIANTTLYFWVDYHLAASHSFRGGTPPKDVGAGTSCIEPNNCNKHNFRVWFGANKMVVKVPAGSGCTGPHIDPINDAKKTRVAGGSTEQTIADPTKLASVGTWEAIVWWDRQIQCQYKFDVFVTYSPQVVPEETS